MLEAIYTDGVLTHPRVRPYLPAPALEMSGIELGSQAIFRYAQKSSDYPTLSIVEPLYDGLGDTIKPGHYELALSDMRDFLILIQSKRPRAIIPVFKIEEDMSEAKRLNDKKYKKQLEKEAKEREKTNKARAKRGQPPDLPYVHMEASMEYIKEGDYYLIKYERGTIKAWGAFKG